MLHTQSYFDDMSHNTPHLSQIDQLFPLLFWRSFYLVFNIKNNQSVKFKENFIVVGYYDMKFLSAAVAQSVERLIVDQEVLSSNLGGCTILKILTENQKRD